MLRLTYTENSFYLEHLGKSLEEWVALRLILSLRVGQRVFFQPSTASFLLPADLSRLHLLKTGVRQGSDVIEICACDAEYVEVTLKGTWLALDSKSAEGIFVAVMSHSVEFFLLKLWQEAQTRVTVVGE